MNTDFARTRPASFRSSGLALLAGLLTAAATLALITLNSQRASLLVILALAALVLLTSGRAFEKSILLTVVVACLMPGEAIRHLPLKPEEVMPLVALFFLALRPRDPARPSAVSRLSATEFWVVLLIAVALQGAIHGSTAGHPFDHVIDEFALYLQFAIAIVVIRGNLSERGIKYVLWGLVIATLLVSVRYLDIFVTYHGLHRATSDQQHLLNLTIPVLFAFALLARNWRERVIALLLALPMLPAAYVTQTRAIWLYAPFSIFLLAALYVFHHHVNLRNLAAFGIAVAVAALAVGGYILLTKGMSMGHATIAARAGTLGKLGTDLSLAVRVDMGFQALKRGLTAPIWGSGLGDYLRPNIVYLRLDAYFLDFTYVWVFWKLGLLGLVAVVGLYAVFMNRVWFVYRRTTDLFQRRVAAGVFVSFVALLIIGFESGILTNFRFNLVWATLMGIFELWKQRIEKRLSAVATRESEYTGGN